MSQLPSGRRGLAFLVMSVVPLFFSTNLIFGRGVVTEVAPFTLAFIRWAAVALALSPFMLHERAEARAVLAAAPRLVLLLGFLGMWICGAIVYLGLRFTTATNATLIYTTSPVIIIVLEALFASRTITWREMIGTVIALAGVAVIILKGSLAALLALSVNPGDVLIAGAATSWAVYSILFRSPVLARLSGPALFGLIAAAGAVTLLPFVAWELAAGRQMPTSASAWSGIAGIVVFASLLAFSGFQFGIRTLGASLTGIFLYLLPPYGVLLAVTVLGEALMPFQFAGIALVMGGVILATLPVATLRRMRGS